MSTDFMARHKRIAACAFAILLALAAGAPEVFAEEGQAAFNNHCRTCHSIAQGDNRLGPSLHRIVGARAAASRGYAAYSQGLKNSGIVWDEATLDRFIADPEAVVRNNNMKPYKGILDPTVRRRIIEFLTSKRD